MKIIAHRGGGGLRMENTLAAFRNAVALGAAGAELDLHLTRDGALVVHHDDALNPDYCRSPDGRWIAPDARPPIAALDLTELRRYDISAPRPGSAYAAARPQLRVEPGQRVPRLAEVIAAVRDADFRLVTEIKAPELDAAAARWRPLADALLALLEAEDFLDRVTVCSFDWGALRYVHARHPELPTWHTSVPRSWLADAPVPATDLAADADYLAALRAAWRAGDAPWYAGFDPRRHGGSEVRAVAAAGGSAWFPWDRDFDAAVARASAACGLDTAVWSTGRRAPAELARLAAAGVHWAVVDYPDVQPAA